VSLAFAPLLVPLATAMLCMLARSAPRLQAALSIAGALLLAGVATLTMMRTADGEVIRAVAGNWRLPAGIEFAVDRLGAALVFIAALLLLIAVAWQKSDADAAPPTPALHPLMHGFVAGCNGAFSTGDLFNLYVWFELALVCSLGLLAQGGTLRQLDATLRYLVLNVFGTLLLLAAVALVCGQTGQLNYAALAATGDSPGMLPVTGLLVVALLVKAAAFPFFAWLPASYHTLPAPLLALFAALGTKLGVCSLIRVLGHVLAPAPPLVLESLGWIALLSMITGVLGAAYHWDVRRILAFHSVSQVGYILLAVAIATSSATAAAIFFTIHHSLVKSALFLVAGLIRREAGHYDLRRVGGLQKARPALGIVFLLLAFALVGIPPLTGFWGKYLIVTEALAAQRWAWAATALGVGLLTLYSMTKIWLEAFWKAHPDAGWIAPDAAPARVAWVAVLALGGIILGAGLAPGYLVGQATRAAATIGVLAP
jgi:multicomponent Na+:H+ antiporter subunit D